MWFLVNWTIYENRLGIHVYQKVLMDNENEV